MVIMIVIVPRFVPGGGQQICKRTQMMSIAEWLKDVQKSFRIEANAAIFRRGRVNGNQTDSGRWWNR